MSTPTTTPTDAAGTARGLRRSRYFLISPRGYLSPDDSPRRVGYAARTARTLVLGRRTAEAVESGAYHLLSAAELRALTEAKALVPDDEDELAAVTGAMRRAADSPHTRRVILMPTAYCNMACSYCGQEHRRVPAHQRRTAATIARVTAMIQDPEVDELQLGWFGGEPLLGLRIIREMSAAFTAAADAHGTRLRVKMTSNGSLLTDRTLRVLHDECRVHNLEVTLDGPEEVHDARRPMKNGRGTFRRTVDVLAAALRDGAVPRMRIGIRANVGLDSGSFVDELITDLACAGFAHPQVQLHLAPVHSWGNDVAGIEMDGREYARREAGWLRRAHALGLNVVAVPNRLKEVTCIAVTRRGELVDAEGTLFSCTEHPLVPSYEERGALGAVADIPVSALRPAGPFDAFPESIADGEQPCSRCPLLPVCGGRCPKLWQDGHAPCPSMKFDWEAKLDLAALQRGLRPALRPPKTSRSGVPDSTGAAPGIGPVAR